MKGKKGKKTAPAKEEAVFAHYVVSQNYSATAEHFNMPISTVFGIVGRLKTDDFASIRKAIRADMFAECMKAMRPAVLEMKPGNFGNEHITVASDAAKVLDSLVRAAVAFDPESDDNAIAPTEIHVHTHMPPPPEWTGETITANTTTTLGPAAATRGDDPG